MTSRKLTETESVTLLADVKREWAWSGYYFHPLHATTRKDVLAFDDQSLEPLLPEEEFRAFLTGNGLSTVLWHHEYDPSEEIALNDFPFFYGHSESFIVDKTLDWIIYWSHEGTVTFGGGGLISTFMSRVPKWRDAVCKWGLPNAF